MALLGGSLLVVILTLGLLKWDRFAVVMQRDAATLARLRRSGGSRGRVDGAIVLREVLPTSRRISSWSRRSRRRAPFFSRRRCRSSGSASSRRCRPWGLMISEAKAYMFFSFLIAIPGTALALLVFAINLAATVCAMRSRRR